MKSFCLAVLALAAVLCTESSAQAPAAAAPSAGAAPPTSPTPPAHAAFSASGLYNLANSYARAGKPGMAVLNYERADLLAPNDADIQANLKYVRTSAHLATAARGKLENIARLTGPNSVAWIGVLGVLLAGASLITARRFPKRRVVWGAGCCLSVAAIGFAGCNAVYWEPKIHEAVVIAVTTPIRATPVPMGDPLQQLSEAETVTVTQNHEELALVRTVSGRSGWVARADLADVVPETAVR